MNGTFSGEYLFEAILFVGTAKGQVNPWRSEVQIDQAGMMTGLRHAPCEIDGGQSFAFSGTWTGDQHYASFGALIAEATTQDLVLFYGEAGGLGHKDQAGLCGW
jgi:hypothetical protein